jgi:hypothetical protein
MEGIQIPRPTMPSKKDKLNGPKGSSEVADAVVQKRRLMPIMGSQEGFGKRGTRFLPWHVGPVCRYMYSVLRT